MTRPVSPWKRRLMRLLGADASSSGFSRSALLPFFPPRFRGTPMVKCPTCASENPARSARCRRCHQFLPATAANQRGASLPVWLAGLLVSVVASAAFWLGLETGRQSAPVVPNRPPQSALAPGIPVPDPPSGAATPAPAVDPLASAAGLTWALYTSKDRLTDHPILGARFGTVSGTPLFTVLCAEGQAALSLKRGLLPPAEGASANAKSTLETIRVGVRIGERERDRVELRFEEAVPESLDAIPKDPLAFLHRVSASRRIRTATDDFDPTTWGEAIARVTGECRFDERPASAPKRAKARR